jgi:hypothetical protein
MGFSISWIAVRGMEPDAFLGALKLQRTGRFDEMYDAPFSSLSVRGGWFLVIANDCDYADRAPLKQLSKRARVIACAVEEHVMASGACAFDDGKETWCVTHDANKGLSHLKVTGTPPASFSAIQKRLMQKLVKAGGDESDVDYVFDVPVELAASLTGFRYDRFGRGTRFEVLVSRRALRR